MTAQISNDIKYNGEVYELLYEAIIFLNRKNSASIKHIGIARPVMPVI